MLTVTEEAKDLLTQIIDQNEGPDDAAIRLIAGKKGLQMKLDTPVDQDATVTHNGKTVLVLDEAVSEALDERTLTVEQTSEGKTLAIE